jgi:hypothetical protein
MVEFIGVDLEKRKIVTENMIKEIVNEGRKNKQDFLIRRLYWITLFFFSTLLSVFQSLPFLPQFHALKPFP